MTKQGNGRVTPKAVHPDAEEVTPEVVAELLKGLGEFRPSLGDMADIEDATGKPAFALFAGEGATAHGIIGLAWFIVHRVYPEFTIEDARALDPAVLSGN